MTEAPQLIPEQLAICDCVFANRLQLSTFVSAFANAVELFELLERGGGGQERGVLGGRFIEHRVIAAKEGVMNIFHFGCSLDALRGQVMLCPLTRSEALASGIKAAYKLFCSHFPHANNTRHAIAHAGEIWKNPRTAREHTQQHNYASAGGTSAAGYGPAAEMLFERMYTCGWEGKVFEVYIDHSTTKKLIDIANLALEFWPQPKDD